MVIHGGFWRARHGKRISKAVAADLARRGRAAWNIEYRRVGDGGGWPFTFDDVGAAVDALASLGDPRLDLSDVSVVGHSAGGQLALWAAARRSDAPCSSAAWSAQAAPCDLQAAGAAVELLGGTPEMVPGRYALADPMELVPIGVPILLVHTPEDETVPVARSRVFAERALAAGDDVRLVDDLPGRPPRAHRSALARVAGDGLAG